MPRPQIEFQALVGQLPGASEAALLMPSEVASQVNSNALLEPSINMRRFWWVLFILIHPCPNFDTLYLDFKGANAIHVLQVLIWAFG